MGKIIVLKENHKHLTDICNYYNENGVRSWLSNFIKLKGTPYYYKNREDIKQFLKQYLEYDSSEISNKFKKLEESFKNFS